MSTECEELVGADELQSAIEMDMLDSDNGDGGNCKKYQGIFLQKDFICDALS